MEERKNLEAEVEAARRAAQKAADDAAADPNNPEKLAAKSTADKKLEAARKALAEAESAADPELESRDTSSLVQQYKGRVILLMVYLLVVVLLSIYLLAGFFMAETDRVEIEKRRAEDACCKTNSNSISNASNNTNTNSAVSNSNANASPSNSGSANVNSSADNASRNSANSNAAENANARGNTANGNTGGSAGSGGNRGGGGNSSNSNSGANANVNSTNQTKPSPTPEFEMPEISIPKFIYVRFLGFPTGGVWSAESYLFLVVFFSGMLGGTIRALHSLVKHLGLKDFSFYWSWFYITLPLSGSGLAIVIYFVLRGGFYGGGFGRGLVLNVFSFAALAALTGLFTDNAMEKLKQVAVTLLADVPPKVDNAKEIQREKESEKKTP